MSEEFAALCSRLTRRAWHDEAAALHAEVKGLREALDEVADMTKGPYGGLQSPDGAALEGMCEELNGIARRALDASPASATELAELVEAAQNVARHRTVLNEAWDTVLVDAEDQTALIAALRPFTQEKRKALERIEQEGEAA